MSPEQFRKIDRLTTFAWCIDNLPLTDPQRALLRTIYTEVDRDNHAVWAAQNRHRRGEVEALFRTCQRLIENAEPA
ncbi:hypothetical protein CPT_Seuss61 [Caulobacter phage Seuss]|uniref:Uncharacterized protein n=1 Tax=Caulobacter phage Seuss TaxID=1675601 RepID=A0A0K1LM42_9CAUD|nr:hypothetical protein HOR08_gp061 [Caulobacter phage Seuss]AKU43587.1 hypothetical protein CPT_Seuss61 [Caulobacter phage Seuss]